MSAAISWCYSLRQYFTSLPSWSMCDRSHLVYIIIRETEIQTISKAPGVLLLGNDWLVFANTTCHLVNSAVKFCQLCTIYYHLRICLHLHISYCKFLRFIVENINLERNYSLKPDFVGWDSAKTQCPDQRYQWIQEASWGSDSTGQNFQIPLILCYWMERYKW